MIHLNIINSPCRIVIIRIGLRSCQFQLFHRWVKTFQGYFFQKFYVHICYLLCILRDYHLQREQSISRTRFISFQNLFLPLLLDVTLVVSSVVSNWYSSTKTCECWSKDSFLILPPDKSVEITLSSRTEIHLHLPTNPQTVLSF